MEARLRPGSNKSSENYKWKTYTVLLARRQI